MFATVITDCRDDNALGRIGARTATLIGVTPTLVRVSEELTQMSELQASGNIIDMLDAGEGKEGVILVNVAPRSGEANKIWENGTPFGFFYYHKTLVVTTIDGLTLSMVKKFDLIQEIEVIQMRETLESKFDTERLPQSVDRIVHSQFRSFDFLPHIAEHLINGGEAVTISKSIREIEDIGNVIWWIDNFGNCKTTMLPEDVQHRAGETVETKWGPMGYHSTLHDVPDRDTAFIVGSSGLDDQRLLEVAMQGGSAADHFSVSVGDTVLPT